MASPVTIGVDLGTTNTAVALAGGGIARVVADRRGDRLSPSIVSFRSGGGVVVGPAARDRRLRDPANTVHSVKRLIGRPFGAPEVARRARALPFELGAGDNDAILVKTRAGAYTLPEVSALVLRRARAMVEAAIGAPAPRAVLTVPASFDDRQRECTKLAGELADLEVVRILNEPTAAALAWGQTLSGSRRVAVYDLGGGTFDLTVLDVRGDVFEVLGTGGDPALGGEDVDTRVADRIADELWEARRFDARADPFAYGTLRVIAERVKESLSSLADVTAVVHGISPQSGEPFAHPFSLDRAVLERLALPIVERTLAVTADTLAQAGIGAADCDALLLVGGATRMPLVRRRVSEAFGRAPATGVDPAFAVSLGAAIHAAALSGARATALAVQGAGGEPGLPTRATPQLLLDVTPQSLRVETAGGFSDPVIAKNCPIPCDRTRTFHTESDGSSPVVVRVAQGEASRFVDNVVLGQLELSELPRGPVAVDVTFEIDVSGILAVRARDRGTGREARAGLSLRGVVHGDAATAAMRSRQRGHFLVEG